MSIPQGRAEIAQRIDHTLLKPDATTRDVQRLCSEARAFGFAAVCVLPALLPVAVYELAGSAVVPCTVVGFPLGAVPTAVKAYEAAQYVQAGARELDMVMALWAAKNDCWSVVQEDMRAVVAAAGSRCAVKVIIETCLLNDQEKGAACRCAAGAGAAFVKTSTGLAGGGATAADIRLMRSTVGSGMGVKASGGIRTLADARAMLAAGASRIGTSSGVQILKEAP